MNFIYAFHDNEYAANVGSALIEIGKKPDVVALEWADIGDTEEQVASQLATAQMLFTNITSPDTSANIVEGSLRGLGPFYGKLLRPLIASEVEIALIDSYAHVDLARKSRDFNNYEQGLRLTEVVRSPKLSLEARKEEMLAIANKAAGIFAARDEISLEQLEAIGGKSEVISIFQGSMHRNVALELGIKGATISKTYIPELTAWDDNAIVDEDNMPIFQKLVFSIMEGSPSSQGTEQLVEGALMAEFVIAHLLQSPVLRFQVSNFMGALIASKRIVESLPPERVQSRLRAAVKHVRAGSPISKVIGPMLPKHSLSVLSPSLP